MQFSTFTQDMKNKFIQEFINDVSSNSSSYYVCFGQPNPWDVNDYPPNTNISVQSSFYNVQQNLLAGKKVQPTDIAFLATNYTWTSNTVYDYYTDTDPNLYTKQFYVLNSSNRVYKCLFNNYGTPSTIEPKSYITAGDFTTADGYVWKYMFSVSSANTKKFTTGSYFPVKKDPNVSTFAEDGAIHVIYINQGGNGSGYFSTNGFVSSTIGTNIIQISNTNSSPQPGIYSQSSFYVSSGTGAGYITPISDYQVNTSGMFVYTQNPIPTLDVTSNYIICPQVQIVGDGFNAAAISVVNNYTSGIDSIQIINRGILYTHAQINILANTNFITNQASATAVIPPPGGHGYNPISELGCSTTGISVNILTTDNIPNFITYRQVSLLNNPISSANGQLFTNGTFNQMTLLTVVGLGTNIFPVTEIVTGFTSGATAVVVGQPNGSQVYVSNVDGTFLDGELITGTYSGITSYIVGINNSDLVQNSGSILYYKNIEPVARDSNTSENIKLYFVT